jgi:hypothetical protein
MAKDRDGEFSRDPVHSAVVGGQGDTAKLGQEYVGRIIGCERMVPRESMDAQRPCLGLGAQLARLGGYVDGKLEQTEEDPVSQRTLEASPALGHEKGIHDLQRPDGGNEGRRATKLETGFVCSLTGSLIGKQPAEAGVGVEDESHRRPSSM